MGGAYVGRHSEREPELERRSGLVVINNDNSNNKGHIDVLSPLATANGFIRPSSNTCFLGRT